MRSLNRYPDGPARALRRALAERHGVGPDEVVIGNGSCELILLAGQALLDPGTTIVHADALVRALRRTWPRRPAPRRSRCPLADDDGHDLDAMAAAVDERTRLVIVCNPNNPTGVYRSADAIERFVDALPEDLAILDRRGLLRLRRPAGRRAHACRWRASGPNLLVTRTFSKAHGLCGLRVGYGIGGAGLDRRHRQRAPALQHQRPRAGRRAREPAAPARPRAARPRGHGRARPGGRRRSPRSTWAFTPSQANFILVRPDSDPAAGSSGVHEQLLRLGVIVRDGASLGCPGRLRVSIGTPDENAAFLSARAQLARSAPRETQPGRTADMMIVMQEGATEEQVRHVVERIEQAGARAHPSRGEFVTVIGAIGDDRQIVASLQLEGEPGVEKVVPILKPYKLVSSDFRGHDAVVRGRRPRRSAAAPSA